MTTIAELEDAIGHLEKIGQQLDSQALEFFPGTEFFALDQESASILEAISGIKLAICLAEFNNNITDLNLQLKYLEARYKQLSQFFLEPDGEQLAGSITDLHNDIIQTKRQIHIRRHQDVNIVLDEKSNKLLEKYQLI